MLDVRPLALYSNAVTDSRQRADGKCPRVLLVLMIALVLFLPVQAAQQVQAQARLDTTAFGDDETPICDEVPLPSDPLERARRVEKGRRYNLGLADLRAPSASVDDTERETFVEQIWPATPAVPIDESALVAVCTVERTQTHFSDDGSNIYTEYTLIPEQVLKQASAAIHFRPGLITIDRPGGKVRLPNRRVVGPLVSRCYLGTLRTGARYVVFAAPLHSGSDLELIRGYELVDGRVVSLIPSETPLHETIATERGLLAVVRRQLHLSQ